MGRRKKCTWKHCTTHDWPRPSYCCCVVQTTLYYSLQSKVTEKITMPKLFILSHSTSENF